MKTKVELANPVTQVPLSKSQDTSPYVVANQAKGLALSRMGLLGNKGQKGQETDANETCMGSEGKGKKCWALSPLRREMRSHPQSYRATGRFSSRFSCITAVLWDGQPGYDWAVNPICKQLYEWLNYLPCT